MSHHREPLFFSASLSPSPEPAAKRPRLAEAEVVAAPIETETEAAVPGTSANANARSIENENEKADGKLYLTSPEVEEAEEELMKTVALIRRYKKAGLRAPNDIWTRLSTQFYAVERLLEPLRQEQLAMMQEKSGGEKMDVDDEDLGKHTAQKSSKGKEKAKPTTVAKGKGVGRKKASEK